MDQKSDNHEKFLKFRKEFPEFTYLGYDYSLTDKGLKVGYSFDLSGRYSFHPTLTISSKPGILFQEIPVSGLENMLFQIGMVELVSYWKAACPPRVILKKYSLEPEAREWWKKLYYKGLGEFFYLNSIHAEPADFMEILCDGEKSPEPVRIPVREQALIPVGGGKDSAVTLELLGKEPGNVPVILNPRGATLETLRVMGKNGEPFLEFKRTLDPELLRLNDLGFLNGHTPFSALLAFITTLAAALTGKRYIALSNESSANVPTVLEREINHQYSKSFEFENDFREYSRKYITPDVEYFSFLRPLNELQIARLFSGFPNYFPVFKSCNAGSKTDSWCGHCAKCLFTWIVLSPFLDHRQLVTIFGKDLFADLSLIPLLDGLTGASENRPFDCIGTVNEVNAALQMAISRDHDLSLPELLKYYLTTLPAKNHSESDAQELLSSFNKNHFLPARFLEILEARLHE